MTGVTQAVFMNQRTVGSSAWLSSLAAVGGTTAYSAAVDSSNNSYIVGYNNVYLQVASYNTAGQIRWQRWLGGGPSSDVGSIRDITVDSSGNLYFVGTYTGTGLYNRVIVAKYNSSGVIQWQRSLSRASEQYGYGVAVDTSGNIGVVGQYRESGVSNGFLIAKYNSSGVLQWQRKLTYASSVNGGRANKVIFIGSSLYIVGDYDLSSGAANTDIQIANYDSSGVIQWQRSLSGSAGTAQYGNDITYEETEQRLYITGSSSQSLIIAKYNLSGVIQWQRSLYESGYDYIGSGIVSYDGYIYVCGYGYPTTLYTRGVIAKYDTSGTLQWQRYFRSSNTSRYVRFYSIQIDSTNNLIVTGQTNETLGTQFNMFTVRVPSDGTKTGTYALNGFDFIYEASSLTDASTSLTDAASSLTDSTISLTDAATSLVESSSSLTIYTTYM